MVAEPARRRGDNTLPYKITLRMSLLALKLPPRPRLGARTAEDGADVARTPAEFDFVFSADGKHVTDTGRAAPALLPKAERSVLVVADADVGWHRVEVPKAAPARLRAALVGAMEEALLDDEDTLHFALAPGAAPGGSGYVAVTHRAWLAGALAALDAVRPVEQVVPLAAPRDRPRGHFRPGADGGGTELVLAGRDGVSCLRLDGGLARAMLALDAEADVRWTAEPAVAAAAEAWLGEKVSVLTDAERMLGAAHSKFNMRQFDLVPRHRGMRALREWWRGFRGPQWRVVRWGLAGLVVVQLAGLNVFAWQQRQLVQGKREAMVELLRTTHPGVRAVLDAPAQMQRETDRLRSAAGRAGEADFEVLLGAAAAAWPDGAGPAPTLRFEPGRLTLAAPGWGEPQLRQFGERLRGAGYSAEAADGRVVVARRAVAPGAAGAQR